MRNQIHEAIVGTYKQNLKIYFGSKTRTPYALIPCKIWIAQNHNKFFKSCAYPILDLDSIEHASLIIYQRKRQKKRRNMKQILNRTQE